MGAWTLAWVDTNEMRSGSEEEATWLPRLVDSLRSGFGPAPSEHAPFGLLMGHGPMAMWVESGAVIPLVWGDGVLTRFPLGTDTNELAEFLAQPSPPSGSEILIMAVERLAVEMCPIEELREDVRSWLNETFQSGDRLWSPSLRVCARLSRDHDAWFVWLNNTLNLTGTLSASQRAAITRALGARSTSPARQEQPLRLAGLKDKTRTWDSPIPYEPQAITVLLGRNGAGKTTVLEEVVRAVHHLNGLGDNKAVTQGIARIRERHPGLSRWARSEQEIGTEGLFEIDSTDLAPDFFTRLLFLAAYYEGGIVSTLPKMRFGTEILDEVTDTLIPGSTDPFEVLDRYDLESIRAEIAEVMTRELPEGASVDGYKTLFTEFLSGTKVTLSDNDTVILFPPPTSAATSLVEAIPVGERVTEFSGGGFVARALVWANGTPFASDEHSAGRFPEPDSWRYVHSIDLVSMRELKPEIWDRSPWGLLYESLLTVLRSSLPSLVEFNPSHGPEGPEKVAEDLICELLRDLVPGMAMVGDFEAHLFSEIVLGALAHRVAELLSERSTEILPAFVREVGHLKITIAPQDEWHQRRTHVELVGIDEVTPVRYAASGVKAWCLASLRFAAAEFGASEWATDEQIQRGSKVDSSKLSIPRPEMRPLMYLVDEPEAHLHPTAVRDTIDVLDHLARHATGGVMVATHSLEFLGNPRRHVVPYVVANRVATSCAAGVDELTLRAREIGVSVGSVLSSARGILLVEGIDDKWAYSTFTDEALERSFVHMLCLHGMRDARVVIPQLDLIFSLEIPIYIALDHVRRSILKDLLAGNRTDRVHTEERELGELATALEGRAVAVAPFAKVDVIEALPDQAIEMALAALGGKAPWPGWKVLSPRIATRFEDERTKFKEAFEMETGVPAYRVVGWLKKNKDLPRMTSPTLLNVTHQITSDLDDPHVVRRPGLAVLPRTGETGASDTDR